MEASRYPDRRPMQIHFGPDLLVPEWPRCVVCIGTFDGVHLGHEEVIRRALSQAEAAALPCVIVTFDRHPAATLAPERCPPAISPLGARLARFAELGVSVALILRFDRALASTTAETFLNDLLVGLLRAERVVVGHDFAMGQDRVGTPDWLGQRIATDVVPPFEIDGRRVSSSATRQAIAEGRIEDANSFLGRPFEIEGVVVEGARLGRQLGYPTANLARSVQQVLPPDGVYVGEADTPTGTFRAAVSVGLRPTIDATTRTIEAYLLDYRGDSLYGKSIRLKFFRRLRDQIKFDHLEALKEQMARDVEAAQG